MDDKKIERINQLSRLAKERELTEEEQAERQKLREEYVASFRGSLKAQLDGIVIQNPDGTKTKLKKKNKK